MIFSVLSALAAPGTAPLGPEPVLELARRDLNNVKIARGGQFVAVASPALVLVGVFAAGELKGVAELEKGRNTQMNVAGGMVVVGVAGMLASPWIVRRPAKRSRGILEQQGLEVRHFPLWTVSTLAVLGTMATFGVFVDDDPQRRLGLLVSGFATYGAAVGIGSLQLDANRTSRRSAGWLGLAPTYRDQSPGLALAGTW